MNDDTIERLELKIAFLERAAAELSDVVYGQQRELAHLRARLTDLAGRLEAAAAQGAERPYTLEEEKPPHY
jgi:SlyX protein